MAHRRRILHALTSPISLLLQGWQVYRVQVAVASLLLAFSSVGRATEHTRVESDGPLRVEITVFVIDIDGVDSAEQNFTANVFYALRWKDPRLAHSGKSAITRSLDEVWNPVPQIINQQKIWPTFPEVVIIDPDGSVTYRQRVWGTFSEPLELQDFPRDSQEFNLQFAIPGFDEGELELVQSPEFASGIAPELSLADWEVLDVVAKPHAYQPFSSGWAVPGFLLTIHAKRYVGYYVLKIILPLLLIVAMSWIVFWIDPKEAGTQVSVAITTMLTLIAYRFAVGSDLPKVSYLTRMDYFILISTILVFAILMEAVITSTLAKAGHVERALTIDHWARWIVPAGFLAVTLFSFLG